MVGMDLQWQSPARLLHAGMAADGDRAETRDTKARPDERALSKADGRSASRRSRSGRHAGDDPMDARAGGDGLEGGEGAAAAVAATAAAAAECSEATAAESESEGRRPSSSIHPPRRSASRASRAGGGSRPVAPLALSVRDDRGWTLLHIASHMGNIRMVRQLLEEGDVGVDEPSLGPKHPGATALHLAAAAGHVAVMDTLLEGGANIEARTRGNFGWTPLHHAARHNRRRAMRFLVESGAFLAPDMLDARFNPPLHYCRALQYAYQYQGTLGGNGGGGSGESSGEGSEGGSSSSVGGGADGRVVGEGGGEREEEAVGG
ncbi:hypothetical protein CLOM_g4800 [Closterium sp. NIES-68]|nr:hypothetical protein CLOM_g4800 [Closterium sp. NIES-68]GJP60274.1 hypothetical protein CLOP_g17485 [Closterium sp. NIES-67]